MKLTGKAERDFNKYLMRDVYGFKDFKPIGYSDQFNNCIDSMKWGVYVDFFDSKNHYVEVDRLLVSNFSMGYARTAAIEKANEIYNEFDTL